MSFRLSLSLSAIAMAAVFSYSASIGSFKASKVCPLYQSKKNSTNPGNLSTAIDSVYTIVDASPSQSNATWVQVKVAASDNPRWVETKCGTATFQTKPDTTKPDTSNPSGGCHAYNTYDSHVLAISWQAGFCLTKSSKAECQNLKKEPFACSHFTLHGLWPNKTSCGINYNFCGSVTQEQKDFCNFPTYPLDTQVATMLGTVMPSRKYGTCLDRHEWWKHGTCRDTSANNYYLLAMNLLNEINSSSFVEGFLQSNIGKTSVKLSDLQDAFDKAFGANAHLKIGANCTNGVLTEIQMNLPKELNKSMADLLAQGSKQSGSCPANFSIPSPQ